MAENQEEQNAAPPGAAVEEEAPQIRTNEDGSVDVDGEGNVLAAGEERSTRHDEDEFEEVATHDASGRRYTDEERERMRADRRDEKRRRRTARRDREDRLRVTVDSQNRVISELTQRLAALEGRGAVGELQQLERNIQEAKDAANWFKEQMAEAIKANDGTAAADFSARMTQAAQRSEQLANVRTAYLNQQNQPRPAPLDPRHQTLANEWMAENRWYNPASPTDPDSRVALAIDEGLSKEPGRDPTSPEYWDELTRRMKKYLPHRYAAMDRNRNNDDRDDGDDAPEDNRNGRAAQGAERRRPAAPKFNGSGGGGADNSGSKGTYRLSKERVEAMQQAGMWNDPVKRARMVKRYQEMDRASGSQR